MKDSLSQRPQFTPLEEVIMESIWAGNKTTRDIYDALPDQDRARMTFSTLSTYLLRMLQKGHVRREPTSTREYHYFALISKDEAAAQALVKFQMKGISPSEVIKGFVNDRSLSTAARNALDAAMKMLKKEGR